MVCKLLLDNWGTESNNLDRVCSPNDGTLEIKEHNTGREGNVAYYHCNLCGKNYADQNGTQQLSRVTTDKLPKPTEPQKYYNDCKYCGEVYGGAFGWLIKFFHSILALFGARK